jgi:hypothetical protein
MRNILRICIALLVQNISSESTSVISIKLLPIPIPNCKRKTILLRDIRIVALKDYWINLIRRIKRCYILL